jgi:phosphohistidine phosphatase SixA
MEILRPVNFFTVCFFSGVKMMLRSSIIPFLFVLCLMAVIGCQSLEKSPGHSTRLILVRHAEKAEGEGDVPLTEQGRKRADRLAALLAEAGVTTIYSTEWLRNQKTAEPLSLRTGVLVTTFPVGPDAAAHAEALAARFKRGDHAGELVVCVEHSNTIAPILAELGAQGFEGKAEYEQLFIVVFGEGKQTELLILRYDI